MTENEIAKAIVDSAIKLHIRMGPGLLESVYQNVLAYELRKRGLTVAIEAPLPVVYDGLQFDNGFRIDLLVENKVIVEVKSVESLLPVHEKQILTYLRLADKRLGLLINFNMRRVKDGIVRMANGLEE